MLRQSAFANSGEFLKGGMHCHTTRSDGKGDPADEIRMHYEHGYRFLALTDHNKFNRINYADVPMTMLSGIERNMELPGWKSDRAHCIHIVGVGDPAAEVGPGQDEIIPRAYQMLPIPCLNKTPSMLIRQRDKVNRRKLRQKASPYESSI